MNLDSRTKNWRLCVQCCIVCRRAYKSEVSMANLYCPCSTGSGESNTIDVSGIEGVRWTGICMLADGMSGCGSILPEVLHSTWSAYVTSFEAAAMDHIFVLAHKHGMRLGLPMYDGAMWHMPNGFDLTGFMVDAHGVLEQWSMLGRSKVVKAVVPKSVSKYSRGYL